MDHKERQTSETNTLVRRLVPAKFEFMIKEKKTQMFGTCPHCAKRR